jgi:hypothetical protein
LSYHASLLSYHASLLSYHASLLSYHASLLSYHASSQSSYTDLDLSIHAKKDPKILVTHSLKRDESRQIFDCILGFRKLNRYFL